MSTYSTLDAAPLLEPVSAEQPAGPDLRTLGDEIDDLVRAATPDKGSALADKDGEIATSDGRRAVDWSKVLSLGTGALRKSKDTVVLARLTEALVVRHGWEGLHDGLRLIRETCERFWDGMHPAIEHGDVEYRVQPITWLNDKVAWRLREIEAPGDRAPLAALEQFLATLDGCRDELVALYAFLEPRCGRDAPRISALNQAIESAGEQVRTLVAKGRTERQRAAAEAERQQAEARAAAQAAEDEAQVARTAAAEAAARKAAASGEPVDLEDCVDRLVTVARFLRRRQPKSALPFRLVRFAQWADAAGLAAAPPAQADIPAPATDVRVRLDALEAASSWGELVDLCEATMATPAGRFWLDIHRAVVRALEQLGPEYAACVSAVQGEVAAFVTAFPAAPALLLSDFTAAATAETQVWLAGLTSAPAASAAPVADDDQHAGTVDAWCQAVASARAGKQLEAIEILRNAALRAPCGRSAFEWKLRLAELCLGEGLPKLAIPLLEELAEQVDRFHLEEWEPRETSARVFASLYRCYREAANGSDVGRERSQRAFERLCRLDLGLAFRDAMP